MSISQQAQHYHEKMFPGYQSDFLRTDLEFIERFDNFAFDTVVKQDGLNDQTRFIAILASLVGCQGIGEFKAMLPAAMNFGVTAVEIKEIVYQAVAYLGIGRVFPFLKATNLFFEEVNISLPLASQSNTKVEDRLKAGEEVQIAIFGESMRGFSNQGSDESQHINRWLVENCFSDYYTRSGLDYRKRELITFCFLMSQGGCEPQLTSHASANIRIGNDKSFLIGVLSTLIPYVGYPRVLNGLNCVNEATK
ncbi:carboxymuconolactone decarboxylase family protein [Enterococcus faecalis]|uniref:carboxymuconolactone decarboxylase family protein n=1 Tax=Enterococcus faecalis TaxID=1351 RepID=UPI001B31CD75|nr:carboxymuconolactone decarboxylase family protein [Enterococcus faecalis]MBP4090159.1 carboxymuconolactone decarboxylase family protein [Enterococcus faecalis]